MAISLAQQVNEVDPFNDRRVTVPPVIIQNPTKAMAFVVGESVEMPCVADGEPDPTYKWQMDKKDFDPSGLDGRVAIQPGVGTLIFARPLARDEGYYQCFAINQVGTALSYMVHMRQAVLEPFPVGKTRTHSPYLGQRLTLSCTPPRSYPQPDIFWATTGTDGSFTPVDPTARITIDPEGKLHFANIIEADHQNGRTYVCVVRNEVMRSIQQGEPAIINPQGETPQNHAPGILWQSPAHQIALRGETWRIKCIFSGSPTPRVSWERKNSDLPDRSHQESYGMELVIDYVQFDDAGEYECEGINDEARTPTRKSFRLSVESAPYWENQPTSVDAAEGETAVFHCLANGIPEPEYFWFLNGIPITNVPKDPRRVVEKNKLTFYNMTKDDAQVVQCNSTNNHGYVWANAYLNVLTEAAIVLEPPLAEEKAAEGQTAMLRCTVFGSPKPLVVWRKGEEQLTGGRFRVLEDGHLEITDVSLVDAGYYECYAENEYGNDTATGALVVRRRTRIQTEPLDVQVYEGTEAKFTCTASTDPEEVKNLVIDWKKDGQLIDYQLAQRIFKNDMDNSLTISGTISLDTGKYTCVARNGLDEDESSAQLVVQGPPDPPNNVIVKCADNDRIAEVFWQPGKENYAPILNFIVQFNTTFTPDTWIDIESNVSQSTRSIEVTLSPYGNYTFRILARNKIGISPPSQHTAQVCRTQTDFPTKNPENVIGEGDLPDNLVIFWTPMPKIEQNAQGFKYMISYRRADLPDAEEKKEEVDDPLAWNYVVPDKYQTPYIPFYISVRSANAEGPCTNPPKTVMGYSGEDEPQITPTDVTVDPESVTATEAVLTWTPVNESPEIIRGFFRGYRIQFAKASEWPENIREQDLIINDPLFYPRPRIKRQAGNGPGNTNEEEENIVRVKLLNLPPFSDVTVQVRVLNKYYAGPASPQIQLETKEGVPGPPSMFNVVGWGSTHFELTWEPPYENNGILVGYNISYQTITGLNLGRVQYRDPIEDPDARRERLTGLQPETFYRVYLYAASRMGKGEPIFIDVKTSPPEEPSPPMFDVTGLNDTWANISWTPSRSGNPGSVFYVQYRPRGEYEWIASPDEYVNFHMEIFDLSPGTTYQVRVVSKNGDNGEAPQEWLEFRTEGVAPGGYHLAVSGWFYGIWMTLLIIILLLVAFIFAKMKRDKWWQRKEDEIQEQVRQLQAEEAARQLGVINQYADTGSREYIGDPSMSYHSDYHKGGMEDDDDEEEDYSDEDDQQEAPPVPFKSEGYSQPQPQAQPQPGYDPSAPPPTYDVYADQSYPTGQGYNPNSSATGYGGVGYQPQPAPGGVTLQQDPNKSRESNDTFV